MHQRRKELVLMRENDRQTEKDRWTKNGMYLLYCEVDDSSFPTL